MGCVCVKPLDNNLEMTFDEQKNGKTNQKLDKNMEHIKESLNNFKMNFNEKMQYIGDYISLENFNKIISEDFQNYMKNNPFKVNSENSQHTYEIKPIEFKNGGIYQGNWNKNYKMDGNGLYYLKNDKILIEGNWINGELRKGRVLFPEGEVYEGEIKDSTFNGKGKLKSNNNDIYEGDFINGEKTGIGKIIFNDGTIYEGDVEKGEFKGNGKMTWTNGYKYIGEFDGPFLKGKGKLFGPNGDYYEGDFLNNLFHGKGKYIFNKNGNEYEGEFQYGTRKGKGIFTSKGNYIYDGNWDNDLPCGIGRLKNWEKNGILKSIWRFGSMAEEPTYELGNEENFKSIDLNIKPDELILNTRGLSHLDMIEAESSQYKFENSLSFLNE